MASLALGLLLGFLFLFVLFALGAAYIETEEARAEQAGKAQRQLTLKDVDEATRVEPSFLLAPEAPTPEESEAFEVKLKDYLEGEQAAAAQFVLDPSLESLRASTTLPETSGGEAHGD